MNFVLYTLYGKSFSRSVCVPNAAALCSGQQQKVNDAAKECTHTKNPKDNKLCVVIFVISKYVSIPYYPRLTGGMYS